MEHRDQREEWKEEDDFEEGSLNIDQNMIDHIFKESLGMSEVVEE